MDALPDRERLVPPDLGAAVRRGWRGLAVVPDEAGARVRLACAVPASEIESLAARGLAIGMPGEVPVDRRRGARRVVLALVGDPSVALSLDLGFADARSLLARVGRDGAIDLVWVGAEDGRPRRRDVVGLSRPTAERLRREAALQGEWRTTDPAPEGFGTREWRAEAARPAAARLACGARTGAPVVVVAPVGPWVLEPLGRPDIELAFPAGPPVPEAGHTIRLRLDDPAQRALAGRLRRQESVAILLVDEAGHWIAQVDLALGDDSRRLVDDAVRAAEGRAVRLRPGGAVRPPGPPR
jgi:hypothetical protein